jgi:threonine/homoserine/homoserine lactone efflux protein
MSLPWPSIAALTTFVLASLVLAMSPGPGVFYIVTRSLTQGRRSGLVSVAAMAVGNLVSGLLVAAGLTAIVAVSSVFFDILRYAGAAYLVYLGVRMMLVRPRGAGSASSLPTSARVFLDGLMVALLNPKTLVFFAAFLPQFMDAGEPTLLQGSLLVSLFVLIAFVTDSCYALAAGWIAAPLQRSERTQTVGRLLGGGFLVALGIVAVLSKP